MKLIIFITFLIMMGGMMTAHSAPENASQIPANISSTYYLLGGGQIIPPPGAGVTTFNISARFKVGLGYSCGKFNFQNNIQQMVNQMLTQVRQLPGQLQTATTAAVAALPGYLLMKANPTLYNLITKTLDETVTLFRMSYKSCKQIESEMQKNPDVNPYQGFMNASVADRWALGANSGDVAADVDESIKTATDREPIRWLGGRLYGTADNPIQINRDIVVAGYNIMIGRTGDVSIATAPSPGSPMALEPIVRIWPSPAAAGTWVQEVLGDLRIVMTPADTPPQSEAGKGLRPKVSALETRIYTALKKAMEEDDYELLNKYTTLRVSAALIEGFRDMPPGEAAVLMDRLVSEMAVNEARERLMLIKQMMMTGLRAPDLVASTGGSTAKKYIRGSTFRDMDRVTREVIETLELKQRTLNGTTIAIINHAAQRRDAAAGKTSSPMRGGSNALDGAVDR
ncbi:MAG: hypothetical protein L3K25_07650 [Gammaproteobacteria bacterium]|nr:hypothetical protein [Gammaproteobacteria bacterium]